MPFTLTHIVAIVPVKKFLLRWLPFSALAIGSMIPDMPMFFNFTGDYSVTHSLPGILTACLPIGLVAYAIFQFLVRAPLLEILPSSLSAKLGGQKPHTINYLAGVILAIMIGAATHVLWDSFTHAGSWGVNNTPFLTDTYTVFGQNLAGYRIFQHGSSVVFLPILAGLLWLYSRGSTDSQFQSRQNLPVVYKIIWFSLLFVMPAIVALTAAWLETRSFYYGIGTAARLYGTYMVVVTVTYSSIVTAAWWINSKRQRSA